jgi:hypothetical protein
MPQRPDDQPPRRCLFMALPNFLNGQRLCQDILVTVRYISTSCLLFGHIFSISHYAEISYQFLGFRAPRDNRSLLTEDRSKSEIGKCQKEHGTAVVSTSGFLWSAASFPASVPCIQNADFCQSRPFRHDLDSLDSRNLHDGNWRCCDRWLTR